MKLCCLSVINVKTTLQAFTFIFSNIGIGADGTNFSVFSLAPMLLMSDVRIGRTLHVTSRNPVTGKKPVCIKRLPVLLKKRF